jgi:hypothetical protein
LCGDGSAEAALAQRYDAISMSCSDRSHLVDGEHLDRIGHRTIAERLLPEVERMLARR